jgi:hypothetical protein
MNASSGDEHRYDDILYLPHHVSPTRPRMPRSDRAAQFAPFAALTGYETIIEETARLAEEEVLREDAEPFDE